MEPTKTKKEQDFYQVLNTLMTKPTHNFTVKEKATKVEIAFNEDGGRQLVLNVDGTWTLE